MELKLYQINPERDENSLMYESFDNMTNVTRSFDAKSEIYDCTYEGVISCRDLEDAFCAFQHSSSDCPQEFSGRSMSVSDIVEVVSSKNVDSGFYYCDRVGFKEVGFDKSLVPERNAMNVIMIEPGKEPRKAVIGTDLSAMQQAVGGYIEVYYPFDNDPSSCIVCNDSGKINNMLPNRAIYDGKGEMQDVIFGPFFICDGSKENLCGLTDDRIAAYSEVFRYPEELVYKKGHISMEKFCPAKNLTKEEIE